MSWCRIAILATTALCWFGVHGHGQDDFNATWAFQITPGWMGVAWSDPPPNTTALRVLQRSGAESPWEEIAALDSTSRHLTHRLDPNTHPFVQFRVEALAEEDVLATASTQVLGVGNELMGNGDFAWEDALPLAAPEVIQQGIETIELEPLGGQTNAMTFVDPGGHDVRAVRIYSDWMLAIPGVRYRASLWFRVDGPIYPQVGIEVEDYKLNTLMNWRDAINIRDRVVGDWARHWTSFELEGDEPLRFRVVIWTTGNRGAAFAVAGISVAEDSINPLSETELTRAAEMRLELEKTGASNAAPALFEELTAAESELRDLAAASAQPDLSPEQAKGLMVRASNLHNSMENIFYQIKNQNLLTIVEGEAP